MALEFQINLGGNFVEALDASSKKLEDTEKHTKGAEHALQLFEGELGKVKAGALAINFNAIQEGGHFFQFDLAEGAALAFESIKEVGEAVFDLGKEIIKAAADAEDLNLAIKLDVGEDGAEKVSQLAESFKGSAFSPKQIKEALLPILEQSGTAHADQWNDLVTAATDVATRRNTGVAGAKAALEAFNDIELNPQRLRGSLKSLGLKQKDFYEEVGKNLGISSKAAEAEVKAGKVDSQRLIQTALNAIAAREGGDLGNATNEGSKTLGAALKRLGNLKENLFEQLAGSRGLQAVQGFLDNFISTMEGPIGTDLVAKVGGAFETIFGDLSGPDGLAKVEDVVTSIAGKVSGFIDDFRQGWPSIKQGAVDVWDALKGVASVLGTIVQGWRELVKLNDFLHGKADFGGIANDDVNENSPAWKKNRAAGLSGDAGRGPLDLPHFADGGIVGVVGEAGPEAIIPLSKGSSVLEQLGGGGGGVSFGDVHVHSAGGHQLDESGLAQMVRVELRKIVEEASASYGVAA